MTLTTALQVVTLTKVAAVKGSNRVAYNVDCDGKPFGQIWTFKAKGEVHKFHAKALSGEYEAFDTKADAEKFLRGLM